MCFGAFSMSWLVMGWSRAACTDLPSVVERCREAGVDRFLLGEVHNRPLNGIHHVKVLEGLRRGGPYTYWMERASASGVVGAMNDALFQQAREAPGSAARQGTPDFIYATMEERFFHGLAGLHPELTEFMRSGPFQVRQFDFNDPKRRDMSAFIQAPGVNVGRMGFSHAVGHWERYNTVSLPHLAQPVDISRYGYQGRESQIDMFDGFARALDKGPAIFLLRSDDWCHRTPDMGAPCETPQAAFQSYVDRGFSVLEFPFHTEPAGWFSSSASFNTSLVAPCELTPLMQALRDELAQANVPASLHWDPAVPCTRQLRPAPATVRDEL
jgi:hypothetical protein